MTMLQLSSTHEAKCIRSVLLNMPFREQLLAQQFSGSNRGSNSPVWAGYLQPRSQGLSSLPPLSLRKFSLTMEAEKRDPGNEVGIPPVFDDR